MTQLRFKANKQDNSERSAAHTVVALQTKGKFKTLHFKHDVTLQQICKRETKQDYLLEVFLMVCNDEPIIYKLTDEESWS